MTVVESMAAGTPVIAYYGGGYKETVVENKTGLFFKKYNLESLLQTIQAFKADIFEKKTLQKQAMKFSRKHFVASLQKIVNSK